MSKVMKWKYKGKPDIVFGEIKESKAPKIILFSIIGLIAVTCMTGFLLRNYLYDVIFNPHIELNNLVKSENGTYFIDIEVNSKFDKYAYIDENRTLRYDKFISENSRYKCDIEGDVNTDVCGEYTIVYRSSNRINSQEIPVTIRISDNEKPLIELTKNAETIACTDETIKTFSPDSYIKNVSDNYYDVSTSWTIYDDDGAEISLSDIRNMYKDISWLNDLKSDDLSEWVDNHITADTKYKEDILPLHIEPVRNYRIEYIVAENRENALKDSASVELVITFDENMIVTTLNNDLAELQPLVNEFNKEHPDTKISTTKPSGNNNQNTTPTQTQPANNNTDNQNTNGGSGVNIYDDGTGMWGD